MQKALSNALTCLDMSTHGSSSKVIKEYLSIADKKEVEFMLVNSMTGIVFKMYNYLDKE